MPQYRSTKTWGTQKERFGLVRTGTILTMSEGDAGKYNRANPGVLELYAGPYAGNPNEKGLPGAPDNKSVPGAPARKEREREREPAKDARLGNEGRSASGDESVGADAGASDQGSSATINTSPEADRPDDGKGIRSSSVRRARRLKKPT